MTSDEVDDAKRRLRADRAWDMLDLLPRGAPHPSLTSTTIEMAAVNTEAAGRFAVARASRPDGPRWVVAAIVVMAALAAGFAAGLARRSLPEGPPAVVAVVDRHLPVLREAGSVEFLEAFARRGLAPPRRFMRPRGPDADEPAPAEPYAALDAAVDDFRAAFFTEREPPPPNRPWAGDRGRAVERFSPAEMRSFTATARALGDPSRTDLVEAARVWHQWVVASDPVERRILPTLGTKERLEWLERRSRPWRRP